MRTILTLLSGFYVVLALLTTCQKEQERSVKKPPVSAAEVTQKVGEALTVTKDYTLQQSAKYRQELERQLKEIDKQLEKWRPQIEAATAEARIKLEKALVELEQQRQRVQQKLAELKEPSQKAWKDVKSGMDAAMNELAKAFRKAAERFKK